MQQKNTSQKSDKIKFMRLILKTIIFFLIINIFYGCINPPVGKFVFIQQ